MNKPLLRAEGIVTNRDKTKILVQCDLEERFYRLPGGSVEFGETTNEAIKRELLEEFNIKLRVGKLACLNESIIEYGGKKIHHCTMIHWCSAEDEDIQGDIIHKELPEVKLTWRKIDNIKHKPIYPEGILDVIRSKESNITHLLVQKTYN